MGCPTGPDDPHPPRLRPAVRLDLLGKRVYDKNDIKTGKRGVSTKKIVSLLLAAVLAVGVGVSALADGGVRFSDVNKGDWYYDAVMDMAGRGIFVGTSEVVNGVGTFSPEDTMTRAQFIVAVMRYLHPGETFTGETWYAGPVAQATRDGVLKAGDFDDYEAPCSREEMAYLIMNAADHLGVECGQADPSRIPDYQDVSAKYAPSVLAAYEGKILTGDTAEGHFHPANTMTRAEGSTVIYRLIGKAEGGDAPAGGEAQAQDMVFSFTNMGTWMLENNLFTFCPAYNGTVSSTYNVNDYLNVMYANDSSKSFTGIVYENKYQADMSRAPITFKEGEEHVTPRPGDIVIRKSDGKAITITATILVEKSGKRDEVLGLFQDVDIWTNTINEPYLQKYGIKTYYLEPGEIESGNRGGENRGGDPDFKPICGNTARETEPFSYATSYSKYGITKNPEIHTTREWSLVNLIISNNYSYMTTTKDYNENLPFYANINGKWKYVGGEITG